VGYGCPAAKAQGGQVCFAIFAPLEKFQGTPENGSKAHAPLVSPMSQPLGFLFFSSS